LIEFSRGYCGLSGNKALQDPEQSAAIIDRGSIFKHTVVLTAMPDLMFELASTYVVVGSAGDACHCPVYRNFSHAVGLTAQLYRRTVSNFMNSGP